MYDVQPHRAGPVALGAVLLASIMFGGGCAKKYYDHNAFVRTPRPLVTSSTYTIEPPDVLEITSKRVEEIDSRRVTVRPDGRISLPLLGDVYAAGYTPQQLSERLQESAQEFYERADVSVDVIGFYSKKIFVFGEVSKAGSIPYDGANTVLETLAEVQPTRLADFERIRIVRPSPDDGEQKRMTIDLKKMSRLGETQYDVVLEEGDIVYVPANPLAAVGLFFQQLLLPIQPAAATFNSPASFSNAFHSTSYDGDDRYDRRR